MLDFNRLRGGPDGWRGSFEDLVRHLAEIDPPLGAAEFRPIEGAGGDGGIEAYWVCVDGSEVGYQAKFYLRAGEIDWSALDGSVRTALDTHPALVRIIIAMPCDLTDVKKGRGTSAREKWNDHRERWKAAAKPREVVFEFLGGSQIERLLAIPTAAGLREYWFADRELSDWWFREKFARTVAALDERYHPEDHVDLQASRLFRALRGSRDWRNDFARLADDAVRAMPGPPDPESEVASKYAALFVAIGQLSALALDRDLRAEKTFPTEAWLGVIKAAVSATRQIISSLDEIDTTGTAGYHIRHMHEEIVEVENVLSVLGARLKSEYQRADQARYAIIEGAAGSGKSHLMAAEVEAALEAGEPAIMLLGTDFTYGEEPGIQIARRLELVGMTTDTLLGALEAAAASRGTRALIAIDALNEGGGARYWRERLAAFAAEVRRRPRLALCVSCRDVYSDRVFAQAARVDAAQIEIEGFQTPGEQEKAAAVYMDRRGIARPPSPWLPPEFINPLFLRTTCVALERKGQCQFPLGLRGAREMMRFYLNAAAATLHTEYDGTYEFEAPLIRGVLDIAAEMARTRVDYIERHVAARILDAAFRGHQAPPGQSWVDLLRLRGLLRSDPPEYDPAALDDPLDAREDVLRFAFQRIQDQLIARSLRQSCSGPENPFDKDGPLAFLIGPWGVEYDWRGVFVALAIEFADEWKAEIVDHMPGGWRRWWNDETVQDAFVESIRWRQHGSFGRRAVEFLNAMEWPRTPTDLLIELSVVEGHPWNAELLHRNLAKRNMPERDAFWTVAINGEPDVRGTAMRLTEWGLGPGPGSASNEVIRLALTTLGWLFTSTNGALRDRATKAATEILLRRPAAQEGFLARFADVDDIYVLERVLAAIAGACLRDPNPQRLTTSAASVWQHIFRKEDLPKHVLLRDYARLIIEAAAERGSLPEDCDLSRCRPPYRSTAPRFGLDEAKVRAECEAVGDHSIFHSTVGWGGDFGTYVVKSRVSSFTSIRLSKPRPLRHEEAYAQFRSNFIDGDELRTTLLSIIELTARRDSRDSDSRGESNYLTEVGRQAEAELLRLLGTRGQRQFDADARPFLGGRRGWSGGDDDELILIDQEQARLWIARRAVRLGWSKKLFPRDYGAGDETTRSKWIERIGKKYQRIAYNELMARLADNYWLVSEWESEPVKAFDTPLDLPFIRDLEPTVRPRNGDDRAIHHAEVPSVPRLAIREVATAAMFDWVFEDGVAAERLGLGLCPDLGAQAGLWLTLYRYGSRKTDHAPGHDHIGAPLRLNDFHFVLMVGVEPRDLRDFVIKARRTGTDFHNWMIWGDVTDGPYLYEAGVRGTWPETEWVTSDSFRSAELRYLRFSRGYRWESHLDGALPSGISLQVPSTWLLRELGLTADSRSPGVYVDASGRPTIVSSTDDRNSFCIARRDAIEFILSKRGVKPLWVGVGERGAWPNPAENAGPNRRWNGILWQELGQIYHDVWAEDHRPGELRRVVRRFL